MTCVFGGFCQEFFSVFLCYFRYYYYGDHGIFSLFQLRKCSLRESRATFGA